MASGRWMLYRTPFVILPLWKLTFSGARWEGFMWYIW